MSCKEFFSSFYKYNALKLLYYWKDNKKYLLPKSTMENIGSYLNKLRWDHLEKHIKKQNENKIVQYRTNNIAMPRPVFFRK